MQIVASTPIVFLITALFFLRGPYAGLVMLMALLPFGMTAAFNLPALGGMSITSTDMFLLTMLVLILLRRNLIQDLAAIFAPRSMALALLVLLSYATLASLFLPRVFAGETIVFNLSRISNEDGFVAIPLHASTANLSQLFRLSLGMCAFLIAAVVVRRFPNPDLVLRAVKWATGVHVALGILDIASAEAGLAWLLSPIRTANYALTLGQEVAGVRRMIGGYPEASTYGYIALGLFGFWVSHFVSARNQNDRSSDIWLVLAAFALVRCTSSSAYVGAVGFLSVFAVIQLRSAGVGINRAALSTLLAFVAVIPVLIAASYLSYQTVPGIQVFVDRSLLDKLASASGVERMTLNLQALRNFFDTYMLGAGLGSVRASNWAVAALGSLGLPGTVIILVFYYRLFTARPAVDDSQTQMIVMALKMGCLAFIMRSLVVHGTPNMGVMFYIFSGCLAGLAAASVHDPRRFPSINLPRIQA